jgi:hypothetical protein
MKTNRKAARVRTTIGDLIVSIMDAALRVTGDERKACLLTGLVFDKMLQPCLALATRPKINFCKNK